MLMNPWCYLYQHRSHEIKLSISIVYMSNSNGLFKTEIRLKIQFSDHLYSICSLPRNYYDEKLI